MEQQKRATAPAVARAAAILGHLAAKATPQRLTDIAAAAGIPLSSTASVCNALEDSRLVTRTAEGYLLGPRVVELAQGFLAGVDPLAGFASAIGASTRLAHETVQLAMLDGDDVLYLARRDADRPFQIASNVGTRLPASVTAIGKAILAGMPADARPLPRELPRLTERSITDHDALAAELEDTARRGYAIDDEETSVGVMCFGVAANPVGPGPEYAMSVTILKARHSPDFEQALVDDLKAAAAVLWPQPLPRP